MLRIIEDLMSLSRIEADRFVAPGEQSRSPMSSSTAVANASHLRNGRWLRVQA